MKKSTVQLLLGLGVSALFLWLAFRNADVAHIIGVLKGANILLLVIAFIAALGGLIMRSYRWKLLGKEYRGVPWKYFFHATTMGLSLNMFIPFRAGDLFQGYYIAKRSTLPKSYTFSTIVVERLMDMIPPVLMIIVGSFFVAFPAQVNTVMLIGMLGILFAGAAVAIRFAQPILEYCSVVGKRIKHGDKIVRLLENCILTVGFLKEKQVIFGALPLTFINWFVCTGISTYAVLRSLDIAIPFLSIYVIIGITVMSVAIPSSPGFVGTWEFFCMLALGLFGIDRNTALSYAVLSHVMAFAPVVVCGVGSLLYEIIIEKQDMRPAIWKQ